jgi:hypothetical protein
LLAHRKWPNVPEKLINGYDLEAHTLVHSIHVLKKDEVGFMLEIGADPNAVGYGGLWAIYKGTPLHEAAYVDTSTEIIQMLIDNGAKKDVKDAQGLTPGGPATLPGQFSWARFGQNLLAI